YIFRMIFGVSFKLIKRKLDFITLFFIANYLFYYLTKSYNYLWRYKLYLRAVSDEHAVEFVLTKLGKQQLIRPGSLHFKCDLIRKINYLFLSVILRKIQHLNCIINTSRVR
ncbi:hypothetical protein L9F63_021510, partial [Diploptera punctata]